MLGDIKNIKDKTLSKLMLIFVAIYTLRFIISLSMGLMPQDAYYYYYSEHLDWCYYDHPPMVAYMLKVFSLILGKSALAVKLADFTISLLTFLTFHQLAKVFLSKTRALFAAILFGSTLLLSVVSVNTTPDVPLLFFWTLSLLFAAKAIRSGHWLHWLLMGLCMGLSFTSKYTALFLPAGFVLFLLLSGPHRKQIFSWKALLAVLFFGIGIFPVVYWNYSNDWASFAFQSSGRAGEIMEFKLQPLLFLGNLGTQLMLLIPVLFVAMFIVLFKSTRRYIKAGFKTDPDFLFLMCFSLPILLFFFGVSTVYWVKLNWMMPGYLSAIILVAIYCRKKTLSYQLWTSLGLHLLLAVQILFYPVNVKSDDTWVGWAEFSEQADQRMQAHPDKFLFADDDYKTTAMLTFYTDRTVYAGNVIGRDGKQFEVIHKDLSGLLGKDAIFIDSDKKLKNTEMSRLVPEKARAYFEEITELEPILVFRGERLVRKFYVYQCNNYKGQP